MQLANYWDCLMVLSQLLLHLLDIPQTDLDIKPGNH